MRFKGEDDLFLFIKEFKPFILRLQSYTLFWKFNTITAKTKRWSELSQAYRLLYNAPTSYLDSHGSFLYFKANNYIS